MEKIIEVKDLCKDFKVKTKQEGLKGSLKSMYSPEYKIVNAVNNISFNVNKGEMQVLGYEIPHKRLKKRINFLTSHDAGDIEALCNRET